VHWTYENLFLLPIIHFSLEPVSQNELMLSCHKNCPAWAGMLSVSQPHRSGADYKHDLAIVLNSFKSQIKTFLSGFSQTPNFSRLLTVKNNSRSFYVLWNSRPLQGQS